MTRTSSFLHPMHPHGATGQCGRMGEEERLNCATRRHCTRRDTVHLPPPLPDVEETTQPQGAWCRQFRRFLSVQACSTIDDNFSTNIVCSPCTPQSADVPSRRLAHITMS